MHVRPEVMIRSLTERAETDGKQAQRNIITRVIISPQIRPCTPVNKCLESKKVSANKGDKIYGYFLFSFKSAIIYLL
jgi:hypothetical protein